MGSKGGVCRYGDGGDKPAVVVVICSGHTGCDTHCTGWSVGARVEMYRMIRRQVGGLTVMLNYQCCEMVEFCSIDGDVIGMWSTVE